MNIALTKSWNLSRFFSMKSSNRILFFQFWPFLTIFDQRCEYDYYTYTSTGGILQVVNRVSLKSIRLCSIISWIFFSCGKCVFFSLLYNRLSIKKISPKSVFNEFKWPLNIYYPYKVRKLYISFKRNLIMIPYRKIKVAKWYNIIIMAICNILYWSIWFSVCLNS